MKFKLVVLSLIVLGSAGSALAFPPPVPASVGVTVDNRLDHAISDSIVLHNIATDMSHSINPIPPGSFLFENEGDNHFGQPGFTLTIGNSAAPNAQCILGVSLDYSFSHPFGIPTYNLGQSGDGSAGFTCHLAGSVLVVDKS